jgi:hypothetical protein
VQLAASQRVEQAAAQQAGALQQLVTETQSELDDQQKLLRKQQLQLEDLQQQLSTQQVSSPNTVFLCKGDRQLLQLCP